MLETGLKTESDTAEEQTAQKEVFLTPPGAEVKKLPEKTPTEVMERMRRLVDGDQFKGRMNVLRGCLDRLESLYEAEKVAAKRVSIGQLAGYYFLVLATGFAIGIIF